MTRPRSRWVLLTVLVTGAMMLSACGNGAGASGDAQVRKAGTVDINAQPVGSLKDGGNLNLALSQWQVQWNYNQVQGAAVDAVLVLRTLLPEPFLQNQDGTVRPNANLLDSAQLISSDPEVIELKMKKKARWSDGTPITYQDWVADWKAGNGSNPNYQSAHTTGWNSIDSIDRGVDDQDVKINFRTPFAEWKGLLNFLYPASMYATADQFNNGWVNKIPVTAGPFKVKNIDQTDKTLTVERDPNWWGLRPKLDTITFKVVDVNSLAQAFQGDAIDAVDIRSVVPTYQTLAADRDTTIHKALSADWRVIDFGARPNSPTADPKVRLALMKGIDRPELAKAVIGPIVPDARPLNNHIYVEGQAQYQDNDGPYVYNKAEAAKELDADGWKLPAGKQVREKNGTLLELRFVAQAQLTTSTDEAQQVQNQLGQIGVKVDINIVDANDWLNQYLT
ncbi:MAG: ABC transporter family substrate-binding protein, partial [Candidatus Dormibacteraceae bacterium]